MSDGTPTPRVLVIYGTRPEAIKMAPLVNALARGEVVEPVVAVTGQHREMLDQVNQLFGIAPSYDLDVMRPGAALAELTALTMSRCHELLSSVDVDAVVVQGDTSSAFVAALAAFYHQIPVVHLEAGLRTGDMSSPFPEEGNRRLISPLTSLHLAPTPTAAANLLREGIDASTISVTGNTVIDALHYSMTQPARFADARIPALLETAPEVLLVTTHRRESWGEKMAEALQAVRELSERYPELAIVVPMHKNEAVRAAIRGALGDVPSALLTEPLDYHEFTHLVARSHIVLTDSGGVQEEAPSLGKPVLVMRDTTERPEAVDAGTVRLVGTDRGSIVGCVSELMDRAETYERFAQAVNPYGDGRAAERGAAAIAQLLGVGERLEEFVPRARSHQPA